MKHNFKTHCNRDQLYQIRRFISYHLEGTDLSSKESHQIILAVDEACANAIIHGNSCDENRKLQVELDITEELLNIEIYDVGNYKPDDREKKWDPDDVKENFKLKRKGGLGLRLMHCIMDKVTFYKREDDKVNVCSLTKVLK